MSSKPDNKSALAGSAIDLDPASMRILRKCAAASLAAIWLLSAGGALAAAPTLVTACPTIIATSGFYEVQKALTATGGCITISAKNVTLAVGADITGNSGAPAGIGIRIANGATGAVVEGASTSYFNIGIEDDAGDAVIGDVYTANNTNTGLLLNGASTVATMVHNATAYANGHDGIHITAPAGARLDYISTADNGVYGVWLDAGSGNSVLANSVDGNNPTDVEIAGSGNALANCTETAGQYGIVIERGAQNNLVSGCGTYNNPPPSIEEAVDHNADCGSDLWIGNSFTTSRPRCTQNPAGGVAVATCETIAQSGYYYLTGNLASAGGDCLIVDAANVTLYFANLAVTGADNGGIGLHVLPGATGFRGIGGINGNVGNEFSRFAIGAEIEADGAVFEGTGADNNTDTGVLVNRASSVTVGDNNQVSNNGLYGYHLFDASRTLIHNSGAFQNPRYGVFIERSTGNLLDQFKAGEYGANGIAGVYIGCSKRGPSAKCASKPSLHNVIDGSMYGNTKFGVVVDDGSDRNVLVVSALGNGTDDVYDGNANCADNLWFYDNFKTSNNASCMNQQ